MRRDHSISPHSEPPSSGRTAADGMRRDRPLAPTSRAEMDGQEADRDDQGEEDTREDQRGEPEVQINADEDGEEEESQQPRAARDPGQPTAAMIAEHNLTHIPYRPWCEWCVRGKAKRRPSRRLCGAYAQCSHARVRMDYAYLTENVEDVSEEDVGDKGVSVQKAESSATMLVMQESQCQSVWAYLVEHKGSREDWVSAQIVEDLETVGLRNDRVVLYGFLTLPLGVL